MEFSFAISAMSSPLEATKSLLRTAVRTFHPHPKAIFLFDALLTYNVLHIEEMVPLFPPNTTQHKDIRAILNPLRNARLVAVAQRTEVRVGHTRSVQRDYYYVNYHEAVDAIKYRIVKLLDKVQDLYKMAEGARKDWWCPRCGAEYDELSILDKVDPDRGFYCERCGQTLNQNEAAVRERGDHAKIRMLNDQLRPFNALLAVIDSGEVPENAFDDAWAHKRPVPERHIIGGQTRAKYMEVSAQRGQEQKKQQATVDSSAMNVNISSEKDQQARDAEAKREKSRLTAQMNVLPEWHSASAIRDDGSSSVKRENGGASPNPLATLKKEEDEKKAIIPEVGAEDKKMEEDLAAYVLEMEREKAERERKEAEAENEDDEEGDEDDEDDEFEDAGPSAVGTPMSTQQQGLKREFTPSKPGINGNPLKRELDADGDSISGTDTGANTPADSGITSMPDAKRTKLENGSTTTSPLKVGLGQTATSTAMNGAAAADSDEDEDFEDV